MHRHYHNERKFYNTGLSLQDYEQQAYQDVDNMYKC